MRSFIFFLIFVSLISKAVGADLPNMQLTPGLINESINQQNIQSTVCLKGFTKTIRPPASYTNKLKKIQIIEYGYDNKNPKDYEEDHLIPLSIGGHPTDSLNLWPQPRASEWSAQKKDILELKIHKLLCIGGISLHEARKIFTENWISGYKKYVN